MEQQIYASMDAIQERHWWYVARRKILTRVLEDVFREGVPNGTLYDLGCGVGTNLAILEKFGPTMGLDMSSDAIEYCKQRGHVNVAHADLNVLQGIADDSASVMLLADVIEHLQDERPCLEAAHRALSPGGVLVVTVPAFKFLWSAADEVVHHQRRYTAGGLRRVIEPLFSVRHVTYFNTVLFGLVLGGRIVEKLLRRNGEDEWSLPPAPLNATLEKLFAAEAPFVSRRALPFGVSVLCVARKV